MRIWLWLPPTPANALNHRCLLGEVVSQELSPRGISLLRSWGLLHILDDAVLFPFRVYNHQSVLYQRRFDCHENPTTIERKGRLTIAQQIQLGN